MRRGVGEGVHHYRLPRPDCANPTPPPSAGKPGAQVGERAPLPGLRHPPPLSHAPPFCVQAGRAGGPLWAQAGGGQHAPLHPDCANPTSPFCAPGLRVEGSVPLLDYAPVPGRLPLPLAPARAPACTRGMRQPGQGVVATATVRVGMQVGW